ncbi:MAG: hypothetical protein KY469_11555 [Actinobacteria bacterium]|nr:hypothetical protein [Actinomycetota bacterium]
MELSATRTATIVALLVHVLVTAGPVWAQTDLVTITVDPSVTVGPTNQHLIGFGWNTGQPLDPIAPLSPETIRIDASLQQLSTGPDELDLGPLLQKIAEIRRIGSEPQVILSYTPAWLGEPNAAGRDPTRVAPSDLDAWEALIEQVVEGVATAPAPASRFEVWNEPDLPIFWQDTLTAFLDMAVRTHRAVATIAERTDLPLEIGGPATVFPNAPFIAAYVQRIGFEGLPLDYVSWHYYGNYPLLGPDGAEGTIPDPLLPLYPAIGRENPITSPRILSLGVEVVRAAVVAASPGVETRPPLVLDEWNLSAGGLDQRHDTHVGASFAAGTLIELERVELDRADLYRARSQAQRGDWGIVFPDGSRKPTWWTFHAWHETAGQRIRTVGDDPRGGVWARATRTDRYVHVLLVNWLAQGGAERGAAVAVPGMCTAEIARLDASSSDLSTFAAVEIVDGAVELALPVQSLTWVRTASTCPDSSDASTAPEPSDVEPVPMPTTGGGSAAAALAITIGLVLFRHRRP